MASWPLALAALLDVAVLSPVPRGEILYADNMEGPDKEVAMLTGQAARRTLYPGRTIRAADVKAPDAVRRQQFVTVLFKRGGLTLTTEGRALRAGAIGQHIDVSLEGRHQPISALIIAAGEVEVRR